MTFSEKQEVANVIQQAQEKKENTSFGIILEYQWFYTGVSLVF